MIQPEYMVIFRAVYGEEGSVGAGMRLEDAINAAATRFKRNWGPQARIGRVQVYGWRCDAVTPGGRWSMYVDHVFRSSRLVTVQLKDTVSEMTRTGVRRYTEDMREQANRQGFGLARSVQKD